MATENLKVKVTADASQAKAEIGKFKKTLKQTTSEAEGSNSKLSTMKSLLGIVKGEASKSAASMEGLSSSVMAAGAAAASLVAALAAIKALVGNAIDVAAVGDQIKDDAQKVFMGTTAYQEWGYVLKQNGVEIGALKVGMRQFSQQVANGSAALQKYGITATDVDTAFRQAVYTIQNMGTETEKIAAATELFGARALEMFPILNLTNSETQRLMDTYRAIGGTMSNELIAASDICTDSITEMKVAWGGLRNLLAAYVIPVVTKIVQWVTVAIAKIRILLAAILGIKETFGGSSGTAKNSVAGSSGAIAVNTGNTAGNLKKAAKHAKELRRTLMGIDELTKLAEKATASSASSGGGGGGLSVGGGGLDVGDIEGTTGAIFNTDTLAKIEEFRDKVDKVRDKLNGAFLVLKGISEITMGGLPGLKNGLGDVWEGAKKLFPVLQDVEDKAKNIWAKFKEKVETKLGVKIPTWNDIKTAVGNLWKNVKDKIVSLKVSLPNWKSDLKAKWDKLMNKFKPKTVNFSLKFSAAVNDLKAWINGHVIAKINGAFNKVPILKNHQIPYLARGGVLTAPTAAVLGEYAGARQNPEIAAPQSLLMETITAANSDLVSAFAQMTRQVIAAIEDKDLDVSIGDEQIARSAQRGNAAYKQRTGRAMFAV